MVAVIGTASLWVAACDTAVGDVVVSCTGHAMTGTLATLTSVLASGGSSDEVSGRCVNPLTSVTVGVVAMVSARIDTGEMWCGFGSLTVV